jgi:hypothetical protein
LLLSITSSLALVLAQTQIAPHQVKPLNIAVQWRGTAVSTVQALDLAARGQIVNTRRVCIAYHGSPTLLHMPVASWGKVAIAAEPECQRVDIPPSMDGTTLWTWAEPGPAIVVLNTPDVEPPVI